MQILVLRKKIQSPLLKHIVDFICVKVPRDGACYSHKANAVPVPAGLWIEHQLVFMFLREGSDWIAHLNNPEDDKPSFPTIVLSRIERSNQNLLSVQAFIHGIDGSLNNFFVFFSLASTLEV